MIAFAAAVFFLIVTPGPGVLSTAGVGAAFGGRAGVRYVIGLCIGTNIVALAVISGVAAVVLADPRIRTVLFVLSTGYLLYLAFRIATAGSRIAFIEAQHKPGIRDGLALQAVNPKAYAVNTVMFSGFAIGLGPVAEPVVKLLIMNAIWLPLHFLWLGLGVWLRSLDLAERTQRMINIAMAGSMLVVVGLALASLI
ncbi:LysE family translocator [Jannaschia seohaensis]|uniref:Threonine/homoserine/homoserine lactone efflux protein n=1 Tax=Jannaschia seohaensis TaxID=475081 RepID=A0A2Y9AN37_9RHOB|nr:LysE family translocator [Jannaschia seohaensis]PWJ19219.1 threonine/homoserine/homoserine lactone efflux protein [Jannaschia seohaensis]SSA45881.1 Threonine/homoserine/homoserine lactone efflux protein [Jannaschia seohaensis]